MNWNVAWESVIGRTSAQVTLSSSLLLQCSIQPDAIHAITMNGTAKDPRQTSTTTSAATGSTLDADIAMLTSLLATHSGAGDDDERDVEGPELQEMLRRLESEDGVARGMESRLDEIIGSLDRMLGSLEGERAGQEDEAGGDEHAAESAREGEDVNAAVESGGGKASKGSVDSELSSKESK